MSGPRRRESLDERWKDRTCFMTILFVQIKPNQKRMGFFQKEDYMDGKPIISSEFEQCQGKSVEQNNSDNRGRLVSSMPKTYGAPIESGNRTTSCWLCNIDFHTSVLFPFAMILILIIRMNMVAVITRSNFRRSVIVHFTISVLCI